jgi:hypothetical protein
VGLAEDFHSPEVNMCGTAMRGAFALPESRPQWAEERATTIL